MAAMHSYEVLKLVVKQTGAKKIATDLNLSLSLVYKWTEAPEDNGTEAGSGVNNPLDRIEQLILSTHDRRIAEWVCERAGGVFVAKPESALRFRSLPPMRLWQGCWFWQGQAFTDSGHNVPDRTFPALHRSRTSLRF